MENIIIISNDITSYGSDMNEADLATLNAKLTIAAEYCNIGVFDKEPTFFEDYNEINWFEHFCSNGFNIGLGNEVEDWVSFFKSKI